MGTFGPEEDPEGNTRGPEYVMPIVNACANNSKTAHYHVKGRFTTNGYILLSQTSLESINPSYINGVYVFGGYIYGYRTSTGQSFFPYDHEYETTSITYYGNMDCNEIHY